MKIPKRCMLEQEWCQVGKSCMMTWKKLESFGVFFTSFCDLCVSFSLSMIYGYRFACVNSLLTTCCANQHFKFQSFSPGANVGMIHSHVF